MWEVLYHRKAAKRIKKLPYQVREKLDVWVEVVKQQGPAGLHEVPGFNDEALLGDWEGYRSSRLNRQYRVIYISEIYMVRILVVDITAHDYRKV